MTDCRQEGAAQPSHNHFCYFSQPDECIRSPLILDVLPYLLKKRQSRVFFTSIKMLDVERRDETTAAEGRGFRCRFSEDSLPKECFYFALISKAFRTRAHDRQINVTCERRPLSGTIEQQELNRIIVGNVGDFGA